MTRWIAAFIVVVVLGVGALFWWVGGWQTNSPAPVAETSKPPSPTGPSKAPAPPEPAPPASAVVSAPPAPASAPEPPAPAPPASASVPGSAPEPSSSASVANPGPASAPSASASASAGAAPVGPGGASSGSAQSLTGPPSRGAEPGAQGVIAALGHSVIRFELGSSSMPALTADVLKRAADEMKRLPPGDRVRIAGYTDNSGNAAANVALSQKRAETVREALIRDGVNPDRLAVKGYGSADPIASNDTPEGRGLNRRIEFQVVQGPDRTVAGSQPH